LEDDGMLAELIENWFEEAKREGVQQGRTEGRMEGWAALLSKLLKLRFGSLPPDIVDRLAHATEDELDAWGEAVLAAPSLEAMFGTH
jgi:flagellar biosynthesis/type III secretory pathway protein FliH